MSIENKQANIREYQIRASSTDTFGRLLCNSRHHHFVVDGPTQNGCPGEALTPPEIFLAGVVTCGVDWYRFSRRTKRYHWDRRQELSPLRSIGAINRVPKLRCLILSGLTSRWPA